MVHRDIKPGNLMLARRGNRAVIKVLDFGLAKVQSEGAVDGGLTHEGQMLGTPHYIAPEQISNARSADIRADIYSLGCTLYCLLTGAPPFRGVSLYDILQAHHSMEATPLNLMRQDVPVELAALVGKMMAKEPRRRFQEPKDVSLALRPFFKSTGQGPVGSTAELSQGDRSLAGQDATREVSATTQTSRNVGPASASRQPAEPSPTEPLRENPTAPTKNDRRSGVVRLAPITKPSGRGFRATGPIIAAAVIGVLSCGAIILMATRKAPSPKDSDAVEPVAAVPKVPAKAERASSGSPKALAAIKDRGGHYALRFSPARSNFVRVGKLLYDGRQPITLEAYATPLGNRHDGGAIISNAEGAGIEIGTRPDGIVFLSAHSQGRYHRVEGRSSLVGRRTHLAGVLDGRHLTLFVDGERQGSLDLPGPFDPSPLPFYVGANPNRNGSGSFPLDGIVEQVRISTSARYRGDFRPEERFEVDSDTLVLYHFRPDIGQTVVDESGHGNDGVVVGAEPALVVVAPLRTRSPVADGNIADGEYGPPLKVAYDDDRNPGRLVNMNPDGRQPGGTVPPRDLSFELYAAHTTQSLFLAFRVTDDFVDDQPEAHDRTFFNDGVEVFFDGDRVPNDYVSLRSPQPRSGREGFQLLADVRGRQQTISNDFSNSDWKVASARLSDGYILEFEIPLALIDTADGVLQVPAATGSFLWFNAAVTDNDSAIHGQQDYGPLWLAGPDESVEAAPPAAGEKGWRVGLALSRPPSARPASPTVNRPVPRVLRNNGTAQPAWSLALTRDGRTLVSGHDESFRSWDLAAGRELHRVTTGRQVRRVDLTPDGATAVSAEYRLLGDGKTTDNLLAVRDGKTGAQRHELKGLPAGLNAVAISPDGTTAVSSCWGEAEIRVWDAEKGRQLRTLRGHEGSVTDVVFHPGGNVLASAGQSTVRLWDVAKSRTLHVLQGHGSGVEAVTFSADGTRLASGGYDRTARVWDAATGKPLAVLKHDFPVLCLAFSPDGKTLATASARWADFNYQSHPARVLVWDLAERKPRASLPEQSTQIFDLTFTPDGKTLITAGLGGAIILWDIAGYRVALGGDGVAPSGRIRQ
jgi:hypothetical protein